MSSLPPDWDAARIRRFFESYNALVRKDPAGERAPGAWDPGKDPLAPGEIPEEAIREFIAEHCPDQS